MVEVQQSNGGVVRWYRAAAGGLFLLLAGACSGEGASLPAMSQSPAISSQSPTTASTGGSAVPSTGDTNISQSSVSSVTANGRSGRAVVTINGKVCQLDMKDAVSVKTVVEDGNSYIEITDKRGNTRRADCKS